MNRWMVAGIGLLCFAASVFAETRYVTEIVNITVRTGKGLDHKIIEMIPSGQRVEIVEPGPDWTKIRLDAGREGWVLSRLLTDAIPKGIQLEQLQQAHDQLIEKVKVPLVEINKLESENNRLKQQLEAAETALDKINRSHSALKARSEALARLEVDYRQSTSRLAALKQKNQRLADDLAQLQKRQIFRWFLAGAGVLFLGFIIGISAKSKRRRSSLL